MTTNQPEFKAHDDFIFEHKEVGKVTREEFIKYIRSSHEHMRKLSEIIQQYNQTIDEYLNEWDGRFESFDEDVKDLLGRWISDGTMDHIINENLMSTKADKTYVDDLNENVTAQLAQTQSTKVDKNGTEQIDMVNFNQTTREYLANVAEHGYPVADKNSVGYENVIPKSITSSKLNMPLGYLPLGVTFQKEGFDQNRAVSEPFVLTKPTTIKTTSPNILLTVNKLVDGSYINISSGWYSNIKVNSAGEFNIRARFNDDSDLTMNDYLTFETQIEISDEDTAVQKKVVEPFFPVEVPLVNGTLTGTDINSRKHSPVTMALRAGEKIELVDKENYEVAYFLNGSTTSRAGWENVDFTATEPTEIQIVVKATDGSNISTINLNGLVIWKRLQTYVSRADVLALEEKMSNPVIEDNLLYPDRLTWGHEYLHSWYSDLHNNRDVKIVWGGDSTTANTSISNEAFHRNNLGKRILTLGGYDETKITSLNHGHGGHHTGDWLETHLDNDLAENPNLYVLGYGLNDGGTNYFPGTTIEERVEGFENRLREGLGRIRSEKSANELPIIITMPVTTNNSERKRTKEDWHNHIRPVIQRACRDYQCAFADLAMYQYDRTYTSSWSINNDNVHPDSVATVDYMSVLKDLIMPYLFRK